MRCIYLGEPNESRPLNCVLQAINENPTLLTDDEMRVHADPFAPYARATEAKQHFE